MWKRRYYTLCNGLQYVDAAISSPIALGKVVSSDQAVAGHMCYRIVAYSSWGKPFYFYLLPKQQGLAILDTLQYADASNDTDTVNTTTTVKRSFLRCYSAAS
jgi:hypothetical protein